MQLLVSQKIQPQEMQKSGECPVVLGDLAQNLYQQRHNDSCPNLIHDGVFVGADEAFDLQILLESLEEQFNLPALLVEYSNLLRRQLQVVGQKVKPAIIVCVMPLDHTECEPLTRFASLFAVGLHLVVAVVLTLASDALLQWRRDGVVFDTSDKSCSAASQSGKEFVIVVTAIHDHSHVFCRQLFDSLLGLFGVMHG